MPTSHRPSCRALAVALIVLSAVALPVPAHAWGPVGHMAVARLAESRLTPVTRRAVTQLLGGQSMADVAVWADEVRSAGRPETAPWHFVNIPVSSASYSAARDCRTGDCVVARIERFEKILGDRTKSTAARQEALRFLIHFAGDVHQPLHAADNRDRGGNQRMLTPIGNADNLHAAWDAGILQATGGGRTLVANADAWLRSQTESPLTGGSPADWANESARLARDRVYPQVADNAIDRMEARADLQVIEQRVALAGVRLAALLNRAIAAATP